MARTNLLTAAGLAARVRFVCKKGAYYYEMPLTDRDTEHTQMKGKTLVLEELDFFLNHGRD